RRAFVRRLFPGLATLFVVYALMTAFRDYRDNYGIEIFRELGYGAAPAIFTRTEVPVALAVLAALGALTFVRDNRLGLRATIAFTRTKGTAVFAIYVADSLGYTASIGVQLVRDLGGADHSGTRLSFFVGLTYVTAAVSVVLLAASALYFDRRSPDDP